MNKPMLFKSDSSDKFPCMATIKRDGWLCIFENGKAYTRRMKEVKNSKFKEYFKDEIDFTAHYPARIQSEIYVDGWKCPQIVRLGSKEGLDIPPECKAYVFDFVENGDINTPYITRIRRAREMLEMAINTKIVVIRTKIVQNQEELDEYYEDTLALGYEGLVVRYPSAPYKYGRALKRDQIGFKMKPEEDYDARVLGIKERMKNLNESFKDVLGDAKKRNTKADKESTGIAGSIIAQMEDGKIIDVPMTGTEAFRREIWENKEKYVGEWFKFRAFGYGKKDVPRQPRFRQWKFKEFRDAK